MKHKTPPWVKKVQHQLINSALLWLEWAMKTWPRWLIEAIVKTLFFIATSSTKKLQDICIKNFQSVYGVEPSDAAQRKMVTQYLKSLGHSMVDLLYYVDRPRELLKIIQFEHEEHLKEALEKGKGVIAVSAHMGNFPLMFVFMRLKGYKVNVIIRPMRNKSFSEFVFFQCRKWGINMIQTLPRKDFLRESLGALKRNETLFILLDEVVPADAGVKVKFFNGEVVRAIGPTLFLERTGSPIVPIFVAQDEQGLYKVHIEPPFDIAHTGSAEDNAVMNIAGLTKIIEQYVKRYPLQWGGWLNKRWANQ